ncbi:MAG TPA: hypothetical protein VK969_02815, partial [Acidimicrobiia bacterium]|nr:hypothetical protein [Acidimicrobiia bacterium]
MSDSAEPRSTRVTDRFTRSIWPSVLALAGATALAAMVQAAEEPSSRSYGASSNHALAASLVGVAILVAVGTVASINRPGNAIGRLVA